MLPFVGDAVIKDIADGANSSPSHERDQAFHPWLASADTQDQKKVASDIRNVQNRNLQRREASKMDIWRLALVLVLGLNVAQSIAFSGTLRQL